MSFWSSRVPFNKQLNKTGKCWSVEGDNKQFGHRLLFINLFIFFYFIFFFFYFILFIYLFFIFFFFFSFFFFFFFLLFFFRQTVANKILTSPIAQLFSV